MAWEWSHTPEAYRNAELNLHDLDRPRLQEILAEWKAYHAGRTPDDDGMTEHFDPDAYEAALIDQADMDDGQLATAIWTHAEANATCDNGGFNAWLCPYGCSPHCVPFDRDEEETDPCAL